MFKKLLPAALLAAFALSQEAKAQTNFQTFYDFGKNRKHVTTTLEGYYGDKWGDTFFFIDYDFNNPNPTEPAKYKRVLPGSSYFEIARGLNFWKETALADLSAHVEYNGGIGFPSQNFLFGANYCLHNDDFSNVFTFELMYKTFSKGTSSDIPVQFTFVWGMQDLFGVTGLRFSGFADIWGENVVNFREGADKKDKFVFISEPQIWYNVGRHFGVDNLHIGGEIELSMNFAGYHGFLARPCLGTKWIF